MSNIPMEGLAQRLRNQAKVRAQRGFFGEAAELERWANKVESASARLAEAGNTIAQITRQSVLIAGLQDIAGALDARGLGHIADQLRRVSLLAHPAPKGESGGNPTMDKFCEHIATNGVRAAGEPGDEEVKNSVHLIAPVGQTVPGDYFQVPRVLFGAILVALSDTMPCEDPACRCFEDAEIDRLYREGCAIIDAAPGSQADTDRLTPDEKESASPSPPVDAQWVAIIDEAQGSPGRSTEYRRGYFDAYDEVRKALNTALSGETP